LAASVDEVGSARPVILFVPIAIAPVIVPPDSDNLPAKALVIVVAKFGSSPRASANSLRVSRVPGAEATRFDTCVSTYNFVAASALEDGVPSPVTLNPPAARSLPKVSLVRVLLESVCAASRIATVPVTFGSVIVRSEVGSVTVSVVSKASAVAPSKTMLPSVSVKPETAGEVKVLLVSVCVFRVPTTSPSPVAMP
jgi:hypothetical protein